MLPSQHCINIIQINSWTKLYTTSLRNDHDTPPETKRLHRGNVIKFHLLDLSTSRGFYVLINVHICPPLVRRHRLCSSLPDDRCNVSVYITFTVCLSAKCSHTSKQQPAHLIQPHLTHSSWLLTDENYLSLLPVFGHDSKASQTPTGSRNTLNTSTALQTYIQARGGKKNSKNQSDIFLWQLHYCPGQCVKGNL